MQKTLNITTGTKKRHTLRLSLIALAAIVLTMAGAGAANGTAADVIEMVSGTSAEGSSGQVNVTADQALGVTGGSVTEANTGRVIINDDGTAFKAPVEVSTGDQFTVNLALVNKSNNPLELQITISSPKGFSLDVESEDGATGAVRIDANTWAFRLDANENDQETDLAITVAVSTITQPGYYVLDCVIEPLEF